MNLKRIGILTSGGDCSGLNSIIRSAFIRAKSLGYELLGFKRGMRGIATHPQDYVVINENICDESMLTKAGSVIYSDTTWMREATASGKTPDEIRKMIVSGYNELGLSGLICVGGDGSLYLIHELLSGEKDLNIMVVPKTIDNDVTNTDYSVGFQTAVEVVSDLVDNIRTTAKSHERTMVVEVMGRDAGFIAMYAGIASGADAILVPEFKYDADQLKKKVEQCFASGKDHCIIIAAESVEAKDFKHPTEIINSILSYSNVLYAGIAQHIVKTLKESGIDSRAVVLGHVQRGGKTSVNDRILGTMFGIEAVNHIDNGDCGKLLCFSENKVISKNIGDIIGKITRTLSPDDACVKAAKHLGVYVGEI